MNTSEARSLLPSHHQQWSVPALSKLTKQAADANRIYIFNVGKRQWDCPSGNLGMFFVPACPDGARCSGPLRYDDKEGLPGTFFHTTVVDTGIMAMNETDGMDLARDLIGVGAFKDKSSDLTRFGVFIAAGKVPTEAELEAAEEKRDAEYGRLIQQADQFFEVNGGMETQNGHTVSNIQKHHVDAVKALGLDRPWARKNRKMETCGDCGQPVLPGAARCPNAGCGAILDEEKARIRFPHLFLDEKRSRKVA